VFLLIRKEKKKSSTISKEKEQTQYLYVTSVYMSILFYNNTIAN